MIANIEEERAARVIVAIIIIQQSGAINFLTRFPIRSYREIDGINPPDLIDDKQVVRQAWRGDALERRGQTLCDQFKPDRRPIALNRRKNGAVAWFSGWDREGARCIQGTGGKDRGGNKNSFFP